MNRKANSVLVMGQNPARSSVTGTPFLSTKSGNKLCHWLSKAGVNFYVLRNVSDKKTEKNRALKRSEIVSIATSLEFRDKIASFDKALAVGRQAQTALNIARNWHHLYHIEILYVPHPSGLNRVLNEPSKEREVVNSIRTFINGDT